MLFRSSVRQTALRVTGPVTRKPQACHSSEACLSPTCSPGVGGGAWPPGQLGRGWGCLPQQDPHLKGGRRVKGRLTVSVGGVYLGDNSHRGVGQGSSCTSPFAHTTWEPGLGMQGSLGCWSPSRWGTAFPGGRRGIPGPSQRPLLHVTQGRQDQGLLVGGPMLPSPL